MELCLCVISGVAREGDKKGNCQPHLYLSVEIDTVVYCYILSVHFDFFPLQYQKSNYETVSLNPQHW